MITVADLIAYRRRTTSSSSASSRPSCRRRSATSTSSATARWSTTSTTSRWSRATSTAPSDVLVRVHSECLTGDVFHSLRCDCGEQLESALAMIEQEGQGVLLYLAQEGRGIGLLNKLRAYKLQDDGLDTVDANLELGLPVDLRDYGIGAQILVDLGLTSIRILTNNPKKILGLEGYGLSVTEQIPISHVPNPHNERYLRAKRERLGHTLHHQGLAARRGDDRARARARPGGRTRRAARAAGRGGPGLSDAPRFAIAVGRFYEDLAERLVAGAQRRVRGGGRAGGRRLRRAGRLRAAAGRQVRGRVGPLRGRRLPGRRHPRRDRPLRLRLRRGRARHPGRPAADRRAVRVRRADRGHHGAGAGALGRGQARLGPPRRRGGAARSRRSASSWPSRLAGLAARARP